MPPIIEKLNRKTFYIQAALIMALGFLLYLNSLHGKFIWDDYCYVKDNVHITNFSYLPKLFTEDIGSGSGIPTFFYRPLQMFTYMLDYALWGLNVFGYHLVNIMLHILVSLCIYWLSVTFFEDQGVAFLAGLLFIVHPVHVEAIASISGRAEPLAAIFMLAAVILYFKQLSFGSKRLYALTLLSFICALLSKESALIVPFLLLLSNYTFKRKIKRGLFLSFLSVSFIYIIVRAFILKHFLIKTLLPYTPDLGSFFERIPAFFVAAAYYFRILLFPFNLRVDYGDRLFRFTDPAAIAGMAITLFLIFCALKRKEKDKLLFFSVFWFYLTLLPTANIYKINDSFMKEHWLYIPSIGFFLIVARTLVNLYRTKALRTAAAVFTAALLVFYSYLTIRQNTYWSDPIAFMRRSLRYSDNYVFYGELGREYENMGKYGEAAGYYAEAIQINPRKSYLYWNLGRCSKAGGKYKEAISAYQRFLEFYPREALAYNELGDLFDKAGQGQKSIEAYSRAIEINCNLFEAYNNLAAVYADGGEIDKAVSLLNRALSIKPDFTAAHFNLAMFYYRQGKYDLALKHCDEVMRLGDKIDPEFLKLLGPYRK